jgi:hypothetical protein
MDDHITNANRQPDLLPPAGSVMSRDEILEYAMKRGVLNPRLEQGYGGWWLRGEGRAHGWPLVWLVCEELGMGHGCGSTAEHQCRPEFARWPKVKDHRPGRKRKI